MINNLSQRYDMPNWISFGDMNIINCDSEKVSGTPIDTNLTNYINSMFFDCQLFNLCFEGNMDAWCNNHQGDSNMVVRLGRFIATKGWMDLFHDFTNINLPRTTSNQNHILLEFNKYFFKSSARNPKDKPKRFENI